jgi:hypothetical protein
VTRVDVGEEKHIFNILFVRLQNRARRKKVLFFPHFFSLLFPFMNGDGDNVDVTGW